MLVPTLARLGLVALAALLACVALSVTASAAPRPPTFRPQLAGPGAVRPLFAPDAAQAKTAKADYSCKFTAYGSGINPVTVSMTSQVQSPWPVNQPDDVAVTNDTFTLPTAVSTQLTSVDSITVSSQVTAKHATPATVTLSNVAVATAAGTLTEMPQIPAIGVVTFPAKGTTGSVALPAQTVTYTPMEGSTAKPAITCTTVTPAADVSVTVGDATGSFYSCVATANGHTATSAGPIALTVSESGTKKTGDSLTVTLASADIGGLISNTAAVASSVGATLDRAAFSADLPVTGAQSGTVHLTKTITDLTATSFSASGKLKLTKAGTVKIDIPSKFGVAFSKSGTVVLDVACTLVTKPAPVALTLTVAQGSSPSPHVCTTPSPTTTASPTVTPTTTVTPTVTVTPTTINGTTTVTPTVTVTPTTTVTPTVTVTPTTTASPTPCASSGGSGDSTGSGGSEEGSGTPAGGVSTGGGVAPGADVALGIGGVALLLAGGGLVLRGARRGYLGRIRAWSLSGWWRRLTRGR